LERSNIRRTAIGLRVKDGVVLAVEKLVTSKLLLPNANRRIQTVDKHMGVVPLPPLSAFNGKATAGLVPDGRQLVHTSRQIASDFRRNYRRPIPTKVAHALLSRLMGRFWLNNLDPLSLNIRCMLIIDHLEPLALSVAWMKMDLSCT
jgi:20S proteasome alpha/beta subunit